MSSKFLSYDPAKGFPRLFPSLRYENISQALVWLNKTFGFTEHLRWTDPEGTIRHAEMLYGNIFIELASVEESYKSPKQLGGVSTTIALLIDNVDEHYKKTLAAGATIIFEPTDKPWGLRQYKVEDLEGYHWEFSQFIKDVPSEKWGAQVMD